MRKRRAFASWTLAALGLVVLAACGGDGPSSPGDSSAADSPTLRYQSANFRMHGGAAPETLLREIADRLEAELPRVAVARNAVHELCHSLSLYVNPAFANNPRWLWESVALYENRELVDPRSLSYLVQGRPPTLAQLDVDVTAGRQVYEVGYLIGEFVVAGGGLAALRELVRTNGNTAAVLGLSAPQFEAAWYAWVRERYLS